MAKLKDVAESAGVSIGAASRILNNPNSSQKFSDDLIARVRRAADEVGYYTNYHARSLQLQRAEMIGLTVSMLPSEPRPLDYFISGIISGMEIGCRRSGYGLTLVGPSHNRNGLQAAVEQVHQRRIDGLAALSYMRDIVAPPELEDLHFPTVLLNHYGECPLPVVRVDEGDGVRRLVDHVVELGHRDIVWVTPNHPSRSMLLRKYSFEEHARSLGLPVRTCTIDLPDQSAENTPRASIDRAYVVEESKTQFAEYLQHQPLPTALLCYHDLTAIGVRRALLARHLEIPQDVSLGSFDDIYADFLAPPLTSVSAMLVEVGIRTTELLIEMAENRDRLHDYRGRVETITPSLIVRESTAPPRDTAGP